MTQLISKLKQPLDKKLVDIREKAGVKLSYMAGFNSERQANDVFDFKWSSETIYNQLIFKREYEKIVEDYKTKEKIKKEMIEVAYEAKVKVTVVIDGEIITREGCGFGNGVSSINNVFDAYELAGKEAETDARKRALKTLGDQFGLSLYDKDYDLDKEYDAAKKFDLSFIEAKNFVEDTEDAGALKEHYKTYNGSYRDEVQALVIQKLRVIREKAKEAQDDRA